MKYRLGNKRTRLMAGVSAISLAMSSGAVFAQDAEEEQDNANFDTIVTVGKRPQEVLKVPVAMTAYSADFVQRVNLDDVKDLIKFSPGYAGDSKDSFIDFVNVRGISTNDYGIGGDPSIGFFKNNVYQGRQGSAVSSLYDLERAEVLRGPQGFLFGRNAISGAISFHTARPDYDSVNGYVEVGVGERGIFEGEGAVNLPVSDNFAIRVAGYTSHENGFLTNDFLPADADKFAGHDKTAGRITAAMKGEMWDAMIMAEYEDRETSGTVYRAFRDDAALLLENTFGPGILPDPNDIRRFNSDMRLGNFDQGEIFSLNSEINVDLEFAKLTSIIGFKDHKYAYAEDYDGTAVTFADYGQEQDGDYFETELRLVSQTDGPLSWYTGASFYKENIDGRFTGLASEDVMCAVYYSAYYDGGISGCNDLYVQSYGYYGFDGPAGDLLETSNSIGAYQGWAAYANLTYAITDKIDFSAGVRYTDDKKNFRMNVPLPASNLGAYYTYGFATNQGVNGGFIEDEQNWTAFTPRFSLSYRPNDDTMFYGTISKGYKAGGYGTFAVNLNQTTANPSGFVGDSQIVAPGAIPSAFQPEQVWSYEVGVKGKTLDGGVTYDIAAYHYKYTDLQLGFGVPQQIGNIGEVKAYGLEGNIVTMLHENFDLIVSGSYNNNEISGAESIEAGSTGNRLSGAPEFKGAAILNFHAPVANGEFNASIEAVGQTHVFVGIANLEDGRIDGWQDVSMRVGYNDDAGWSVTAYVENVFNNAYFDAGYEGVPGTFPTVLFGASRPTTIGLQATWKFGN